MTKYPDTVSAACAFAALVHKNQVRKFGPPEPYWNHLKRVAATVHAVGGDEEMVAAAWLHDTLEDHPDKVSAADLKALFGDRVTGMVVALTDVGHEYGNRAARKAIDTARLAAADADTQTIKLADLIDNTSTITEHDPKFAKLYLKEKADLLKVMTKGNASLYTRAKMNTGDTDG